MTLLGTPALALTTLLLLVQTPGDPSAPGDLAPRVVLEDSAGAVRTQKLEGFSLDAIAGGGVTFLRFEGVGADEPLTPPADPVIVELLGGGRAIGSLAGGEGEFFDLRLAGGSRLRLSIEEIVSFRLPGRFPEAWTQPVLAADEGDRLYRRSGPGLDRIDGAIESFDDKGVTLDTSLGIKSFPWSEVAALFIEVFEPELQTPNFPKVVVDLVDGSRLPMGLRALSPAGLDLMTSAGRGLRLSLDVVAEVFLVQPGVVFLSDLDPQEVPSVSAFGDDFGMVWSMRRDRSTSGGPLRAGGKRWTRGLGVHAPMTLKYTLDGSWKHLRGFVAIDDEVIPLPAQGSVIFRVSAGGKVLWESPVMRGGDKPLRIPDVALEGVTALELECLVADDMHLGDRANWLRVLLSR